jgi:multidrug efflux pump subunit AcrB
VTRAIQGLFVEGTLGAVLTGLMVLLFLRDWRSSLVVVLNIPLAILASVTALWVSGQTINIMTLGGLALAVGILVDEATVTIENIHTRLADGHSLARAASVATAETTLPRFVAMLCILAVFIPAFFMTGAARNLRTAGVGSRLLDGGVVSAFQYLRAGTVRLDAARSE